MFLVTRVLSKFNGPIFFEIMIININSASKNFHVIFDKFGYHNYFNTLLLIVVFYFFQHFAGLILSVFFRAFFLFCLSFSGMFLMYYFPYSFTFCLSSDIFWYQFLAYSLFLLFLLLQKMSCINQKLFFVSSLCFFITMSVFMGHFLLSFSQYPCYLAVVFSILFDITIINIFFHNYNCLFLSLDQHFPFHSQPHF